MFEEDGKIIKIDGRERFLEVKEFFSAGKVSFQFSTYNPNNQTGSKITTTVKIYFGLDDLMYLSHMLSDEEALWHRLQKAQRETPQGKDVVVKAFYSGSSRNGNVYSRTMTIEKGSSLPIVLKARECPGIKTPTGAIKPDTSRWKEGTQVIIGLTFEQCYKLSKALERAVAIYDRWVADRVLDKRLAEISYKGKTAGAGAPQQVNNTGYYSSTTPADYQEPQFAVM